MNTTANENFLTHSKFVLYVDELCGFTLASDEPQTSSVILGTTQIHIAAFPTGTGIVNLGIAIDHKVFGPTGYPVLDIEVFTDDNVSANEMLTMMLLETYTKVQNGMMIPVRLN